MISYLLNSRPFGEPVSDHDAQEMVMLTMQGGFDTTGSAISSASASRPQPWRPGSG